MYQNTIARFNTIAFTIITIICAVLPFFFLPATLGGIGPVKGVVLYGGVFLAFSFWLVAQFLDGSVKIPRNRALLAIGLWVVFSLISALLSTNSTLSLWGRGFVIDSFATVLVLALFAFMIASFAREQRKLIKLFLASFTGSVFTVFLQVALYALGSTAFVSQYLSHVATGGTLVGSWVDFAYFVIFTFVISLLMFEVLAPKGFFRFLSLFAIILSIVTLIFLNFKAAWVIAIVSALLVFVYKSSVERSLSRFVSPAADAIDENTSHHGEKHSGGGFPFMSFISLLIGLFFFLASGSIGSTLANKAGMTFTDIRPSFGATTDVMRSALAKDPILGAGAGRYGDVWNLYHPLEINQTMFWNTSFDTGYNLLQSLLTTNGILPVLFLIAALVVSLMHGFKLFNYQFPDRFSRFIAVTSLIMLIAFVCLIIFASPGIILVTFGFMYLALLIGVSTMVGRTKLISLNYLRDPRLSFFAILILVLAAMAGFSAVFFSGNRFASIVVYNRALAATEFDTASRRIDRALSLSQNDIFWRTRTVLYTSQFSNLANVEDVDKAQLQTSFTQAEQSAQAAVAWDPGVANNWLTLSQVYQLVVDKENTEAFTNAKRAADEAQKRNPNNPLFSLNQAQLAYRKGDTQSAFDSIAQAISLKSNYLDAYILRGQINRQAGETQAIKNELVAYTSIARFDPEGYVLLGQAHLELKKYTEALSAFSIARELAPNDPNVYLQYIGTLEAMGSRAQAVEELRAFITRFPTVEGVEEQISRIQNTPFTPPAATTTTQEGEAQ
ncbi:MAG: tetratricopeptide repeat protein [Minisyncoccia bacterium]